MKLILIIIIAFLVVMYLFIFLKNNKGKKANEINSVEDFHLNYTERREEMRKRRESAVKPTNYITKYNSSEDYREK